MKPLLIAAVLGLLAGGAFAQNAKGTGAESQTSTTTNPGGTVKLSTPSDGRQHADEASGTNHSNMSATKSAQEAYEKKGKSGASLR